VAVPLTYDHAPYIGQHDYLNKSTRYVTVAPGKSTGWVEVGGLMDTFNHGSWKVTCGALAPPSPPPPNEALCVNETKKQCPMGPPPWNVTQCSLCVASKKCPNSCTVLNNKNHTYGCNAKWQATACKNPPAPPPAAEVKCWGAIATICAQNRTGGHKYASNQTECLHCAMTHVNCKNVPTPGHPNKTHWECPMRKCPRACGKLVPVRDPETKKTTNVTVCQEVWCERQPASYGQAVQASRSHPGSHSRLPLS
jgi:hypothetical protein